MTGKLKEKLDRKFWMTHLVLPLGLFLFAAVACEVSSIDLILADRYFDFSRGIWPGREGWWTDWLVHRRGKELVAAVAVGSLIAFAGSFGLERLRPLRFRFLYLVLVIAVTAVGVSGLKKATGRHCPWDIDRYGGEAPYRKLFEPLPQACAPGNCFPAGHASGGFSLFAGYFAWRDRRRKLAQAWLAAGLSLGSLYGWGQMVRGAHLLSHNFWSAIICWLLALGLYLALRPRLTERSG